jgi:DNA-binding HxlR family transcriptional regulator
LSDRLKKLTEAGVLEQKFYSMHPPRAEYVLTGKGRELGPILKTLRSWGTKHT